MSEVIGIRRRTLSPPILWAYGQTTFVETGVTTEDEQTFNESTSPADQITQTDVDTLTKQIYGQNYKAQIIKGITKAVEIQKVSINLDKSGTPPKNAVVEFRKTEQYQGYGFPVVDQKMDTEGSAYISIYHASDSDCNEAAQSFTTSNYSGKRLLEGIELYGYQGGSSINLYIEIWTDDGNGHPDTKIGGVLVQSTVFPGTSGWTDKIIFRDQNIELDGNTSYVLYIWSDEGGSGTAWARWHYKNDSDAYANGHASKSIDKGPWQDIDYDFNFILYLSPVETLYRPSSTIIESWEVTSSEAVGWIDHDMTQPYTYLGTNMRVAIVVRQKGDGGDSSNYYRWASAGSDAYTPEKSHESTDAGLTWTEDWYDDHGFKINGVLCAQLYSGTINIEETLIPAAKGRLEIEVSGRAISGTIKIAGVVDDASDSTTTSSQTAVPMTCFRPKIDFTDQDTSVSWAVYGNGNGTVYSYTLTRAYYYNKNPIVPADFGKHALVLASGEMGARDEVKLNGSFFHLLPNLKETTWPFSFRGFGGNVQVSEAEVLRGNPVLIFLGW